MTGGSDSEPESTEYYKRLLLQLPPGQERHRARIEEKMRRARARSASSALADSGIASTVQGPLLAPGPTDLTSGERDYLEARVREFGVVASVYEEMSIWGNEATPTKRRLRSEAAEFFARYGDQSLDVYKSLGHAPDAGSPSFKAESISQLVNVINEHGRVAVIGDPGSGKSTTLRRLAFEYATQELVAPAGSIPVYVDLGRTKEGELRAVLAAAADGLDLERVGARAIFLIDGLNEVGLSRVAEVSFWLASEPDIRVVVACRKADYVDRALPLRRIDIRPLSVSQIYGMIGRFFEREQDQEMLFWALAGPDANETWRWFRRERGTSATFADFWTQELGRVYEYEAELFRVWSYQRAAKTGEGLPGALDVVSNPYMLELAVRIFFGANEEPPANRGQLFARFAKVLLRRGGIGPSSTFKGELRSTVVQRDLSLIAYAMFDQGLATSADDSWVRRFARDHSQTGEDELLAIARQGGILRWDADSSVVRFHHQLLQEYFASIELDRRVRRGDPPEQFWKGPTWWEPTPWDEVVLLLAGVKREVTQLVEWLAPVNPTLAFRVYSEPGVTCRQSVAETLLFPGEDVRRTCPIAKAKGGQEAAKSDLPTGQGILRDGTPDLAWCRVDRQPFSMGGADPELRTLGLEVSRRQIDLGYLFLISRFPITYAQFEPFVEDGYTHQKYWTEAGWAWRGNQVEPRLWHDPTYHVANHPIVGVSWFEAVAYTRWLQERLARIGWSGGDYSPELASYEIGLPLEAEWELAAQGTRAGQRFPWGDNYEPGAANVDETFTGFRVGPYSLRKSTAVGLYPRARSRVGADDMCGNVWEWCASRWAKNYAFPEDADLEGLCHRAVRGGSWYNSAAFASIAAHDCHDADLGVNDVGFRIVARPPGAVGPRLDLSPSTCKVLIAGLASSGKSEFIKSVSSIPLVSVQKRVDGVDQLMDYGRLPLAERMVYLYAPVGGGTDEALWAALATEMDAMVFLVDAQNVADLPRALQLMSVCRDAGADHAIVAITKPDLDTSDLRAYADVADYVGNALAVLPCAALDREDVLDVLRELTEQLDGA